MTEEFNLSHKAVRDRSHNPIPNYYWEKDVQLFIKKLKEELKNEELEGDNEKLLMMVIEQKIDKLAGDKLK